MSNRHRLKVSPVAEALRSLDGVRIPGGCDHCNAYQVVTAPAFGEPNIAMVNVFHDDDCPTIKEAS